MMKSYTLIDSFENSEKNRCVDIVQEDGGFYRYQEWRRDVEDLHGWHLLKDSLPLQYSTTKDAIEAAQNEIIWFKK
jgi:hypothetical protein